MSSTRDDEEALVSLSTFGGSLSIRSSLDEEESSRIERRRQYPYNNGYAGYRYKTGGETVVYSTMPVGIIVTPDNVITVKHTTIRSFMKWLTEW